MADEEQQQQPPGGEEAKNEATEEPPKPEEEKKEGEAETPPETAGAEEKKEEKPPDEAGSPSPPADESGKDSEGEKKSKKRSSKTKAGKSQSKSKALNIPMTPMVEEEGNRSEKEKLDRIVLKIQTLKPGAKPISDEDYLKARLFYTIFREKELGTGQYCKVFRSNLKGQEQAVKIVPLTGEAPLRYKEQMQATGLLVMRYLIENPHQSIVPIYEIYTTPQKVYVFMELLTDHDLEHYSKKTKVKEGKLKKYVLEVAEAMNYLFNNGIAHRNIRPANVVFTAKRESAKLGGFDLAALIWNPEKSAPLKQKRMHTSDFQPHMAPEVIKEDHSAVVADIFSLGCLIVTVLTKKPAFDIKTKHYHKAWETHLRRHDVHPSKELNDLLKKMLEADPNKRISLSSILAHPWFTK